MTPQTARPVAIAHRAGNDLRAVARAAAAGVDFVEVDLRWDRGPVARHARRLLRLPLYWDPRRLRWRWRPAPTLEAVLGAVRAHRLRPYLDIKAEDRRLPAAVLRALQQSGLLERTEVSGQYWPALERLREGAPGLRLFRSVGRPAQLEALRSLLDDDPLRPAGVAVDRYLLTPALAGEMRRHGLDVYVWGVTEEADARRLLDWGATGVIADDLALLKALKAA